MKTIRVQRQNGAYIELVAQNITAVEQSRFSTGLYPETIIYLVGGGQVKVSERADLVSYKLREA